MGRIRTMLIKRTGSTIIKTHPEKFSKDFEHNKKALNEVSKIPSKKLRNIIAGYITSLNKKSQKH